MLDELNETTQQQNSSETLEQRFDRERNEWKSKIDVLTTKMRDIYTCSEVLVEALNDRQIALEYSHMLMNLLSKSNAKLRAAKKERYIYYSQEYDLKLDRQPKEIFVDCDVSKQLLLQEMIDSHLKYMRSTIDTIDKILYGCKWRIDLEQYKRDKN